MDVWTFFGYNYRVAALESFEIDRKTKGGGLYSLASLLLTITLQGTFKLNMT